MWRLFSRNGQSEYFTSFCSTTMPVSRQKHVTICPVPGAFWRVRICLHCSAIFAAVMHGLTLHTWSVGRECAVCLAVVSFSFVICKLTSSSAITEGPRVALSQLKSCRMLHSCTKITFDQKDCPFMWYKNIAGRFFGLVTKHACDGRTELRLWDCASVAASRGKNHFFYSA